MSEEIKENKMGVAPVLPLIVSMSLPSMFSMMIQALYNVVDSIFVAQYSPNALAAVSLAFPVQMLMISVAVGTGIGVNSLVSRRLGEKNFDQANSAATHAIFLSIVSWLVIAVLSVIFIRPFFKAYTDNPVLFKMGVDYTLICTVFSFGVFIEICIEKILQATGNMLYPMFFQLVGAITNIILDPLLIFGIGPFPELGVAGAAIATVTGEIIAMLFSIYVILRKNHEVKIKLRGFKPDFKIIRDIYEVGLPSIIMQSIGSVLITFMNMILVGFSELAVSVLGVYFKLQSFIFMPVFGLTHGVMPIIGYSYGARNKKRLLSALKIGCIFAFCIMLVGSIIFLVFPKEMLYMFNAEEKLLSIGVPALRIISICFMPAAIDILISTMFQAIGLGRTSLYISLLRQLVVILPAAYLLSKLGLFYVWFSFPIAELVSLFVSVLLLMRIYRSHIKDLEPLEA